jgi:cell division protein FtsX
VRFRFLINEIWTGLRRNVTMTVAMILTTAISIGLFGGALLVWRLAVQSSNIYLSRVESQVFLTPDEPLQGVARSFGEPQGRRIGALPQPGRGLSRRDP